MNVDVDVDVAVNVDSGGIELLIDRDAAVLESTTLQASCPLI